MSRKQALSVSVAFVFATSSLGLFLGGQRQSESKAMFDSIAIGSSSREIETRMIAADYYFLSAHFCEGIHVGSDYVNDIEGMRISVKYESGCIVDKKLEIDSTFAERARRQIVQWLKMNGAQKYPRTALDNASI